MQDGIGSEDSLIRDLAESYRGLEGRIKEMRNDLTRPQRSSAP